MNAPVRLACPEKSADARPSVVRPAPWLLRALFAVVGRLWPALIADLIVRRMFTPVRRVPPLSALQAAGTQQSVACGAETLQCWAWRQPEARGAVLLVHGWEGTADDLAAFVPGLFAAGLDVIAFDAPAHGRSGGRQTDVHRMAAAIEAVLAAMVLPSAPARVIVAHSVGAAASLVHQSRSETSVERLVLLAPAGELSDELDRLAAALSLPAGAQAALRQRIEARYGLPLAACSTRRTAALLGLPTLLIHDHDDRVVPLSDSQALVRAMPAALLQVTTGLGHRRLLKNPAVIEQVLGFCASTAEATA